MQVLSSSKLKKHISIKAIFPPCTQQGSLPDKKKLLRPQEIIPSNFINISQHISPDRPSLKSTSPSRTIPSSSITWKEDPEKVDAGAQLSLIKDPLWRRMCDEIMNIMGPIAVQLFQAELGVPQDKTMDIYCRTEELAHFVHTYKFIVLATLQRYFPSLKVLNIQAQSNGC